MLIMDAFVEAFFAIDQDHSETITIEELQTYMVKNDMDPAFIARWQELFDPQQTGVITLSKFCDVLGLEVEALRIKYVEQEEAKQVVDFDSSSMENIHARQQNGESDHYENNLDNGLSEEITDLKNYQEISGDMPIALKKVIVNIVRKGEKLYEDDDKELVKWIKLRLDRKFKRLWHCVIVRGQYASFYSYQPGHSFCFRIGSRVFLLFKTPRI
uniref:EF-hand domain-containing protein n=1 Tax=Trichobilharzia regenti TaxID=157069 RepID=A0AA85KQL8_TRIRE|nr:unnamed protein product [Trichobilharzia regenti]